MHVYLLLESIFLLPKIALKSVKYFSLKDLSDQIAGVSSTCYGTSYIPRLSLSLKGIIQNEVICQRTKVNEISLKVGRLKWQAAFHICSRTDNRYSKRVLE